MAKTEADILRYLNGDMSNKEMEEMQLWVNKRPKHARKVEAVRQINLQAREIPSYRKVDVDVEWKRFMANRQTTVSELDLLYLSDGTADYSTKRKLQDWKNRSQSNKNEYELTEALGVALMGIKDYKSVDTSVEWRNQITNRKQVQSQETVLEAYAVTDQTTPLQQPVSGSSRVFPMWARYAAAATVALLITAGAWLFRPQSSTITYATAGQPESIELSDGTIVHLDPNSELTYYRDVTKVDQRDVLLDGSATFDVAIDEDRPFELTTKDEIGVSVLGTIFSINDDATHSRLIKNQRGRVKAYSVVDPTISQILEEGDEVGFDGSSFEIILPVPIKNETSYEVLFVLDHIMRTSGWKVITRPNTEFTAGAKVMVDLDQPYEDILRDMSDKGLLDYRELSCSGCYEISKFIGEQ